MLNIFSNPAISFFPSYKPTLYLVIALTICRVPITYAIPQFALDEGLKCINCHATTQGGGARNQRGKIVSRDTGLLMPESVRNKLGILHDKTTLFNGRFTAGSDVRFQMAKSHKSEDAKRRFFPMQAAVYSTFTVSERLFAEASYNFGPRKFFGQQKWTASAVVQPRNSSTQLRIGYFQPSVGIRYDDHTTLPRQVAGADGSPLIAPNFAEYGAEFNFNKFQWLTLAAGIFDSGSISENVVRNKSGTLVLLIHDDNSFSGLGRFEVREGILDDAVHFNAGSSFFFNGNFNLLNVFSGIGLKDKLSVMVEYSHSSKRNVRTTDNIMMDITCFAFRPLLAFLRYERGTTLESFSGLDFESYSNHGVIGAQIFVMPSVELRPEYRLVDTEQFRSTRFAVQIHFFL